MKFQILSLAVFLFLGLAAADINSDRQDGLKQLENFALNVINIGNQTNEILKWKPTRVSEIYSHVQKHGEQIKNWNLGDIAEETKSFNKKADILNCKNSVYGCIASTANAGEVKIKNDHATFVLNIKYESDAVIKKQSQDIENWTTAVNTMKVNYEKEFSKGTQDIYQATQPSVIKTIVSNFEASSKKFSVLLTSIDLNLNRIHLECLKKMQTFIASLRTMMTTSKTKIFDDIKKCVPEQ